LILSLIKIEGIWCKYAYLSSVVLIGCCCGMC
jgi:hypothetical protein